MNARFDNVAMVPVPSHSGFSVDALSFNLFDSIASEYELIGTIEYMNDTSFRVNDVFDDDDDDDSDLADASLVTDLEDGDTSLGSIGPLTPTKSLPPLIVYRRERRSKFLSESIAQLLGLRPILLEGYERCEE